MKPFQVFIDGEEFTGWTSAKLTRKKQDLTGSFSCEVFFSYMPSKPVMAKAQTGKDVIVYVGGQLAFFGSLDRRKGKGKGDNSGAEMTSSIDPNKYSVSLTARGRTKLLIESSHQHPTGTMKKPTTREVAEALTKDFNIELDWQSDNVKLDRVCFRDGCNIVTELQRLGNENGHFFYETRDGKLLFTDQPNGTGDDLVLGKNILAFSADQTEEHQKSEIVVKGQRTSTTVWGDKAVIEINTKAKNAKVESKTPLIIQHYGDATPEALARRTKFENDKRTSQSLKVSIEVFHVQTPSGNPWDIGQLHYVEVPPEGVFNMMECVEIEYSVDAETCKTTLTMAPPPSPKGDAVDEKASVGKARRKQLGVDSMDVWQAGDLEFSTTTPPTSVVQNIDFLGGVPVNSPPLTLPK